MGYRGIGFYITLGTLALSNMALSIMTLDDMTCNRLNSFNYADLL